MIPAELQRFDTFVKKCKMNYCLHKIKTFRDLLIQFGWSEPRLSGTFFPHELNKVITPDDVEDYISDRRIELTTKLWLKDNPPRNEWSLYDEEKESGDTLPEVRVEVPQSPVEDEEELSPEELQEELAKQQAELDEQQAIPDYSPVDGVKATLVPFQQRAEMQLFNGMVS